MGALDAEGVYRYDETDDASPFSDLLNLLAGSVSTVISGLRNRITSLENPADTGWVPITPANTGNAATSWNAPTGGSAMQVRKRLGRIQWRGVQRNNSGVIAAGTHTIGTLPVGMAPPAAHYCFVPGWVSGGAGPSPVVEIIVSSTGTIQAVVPGNTTGLRMHGVTYLGD